MSATEIEEAAKLARHSRRNVANEASLVWTAVGGVLFFFSPGYMSAGVWERLGFSPNPLIVLVIFSVVLGGLVALPYRIWASRNVEGYKFRHHAQMAAFEAEREAEKLAKIAAMRNREGRAG